MAEVKVLIAGFTNADSASQGEEKTRATTTLIRDEDLIILSDPGVLDEPGILIEKLKAEGLTVDDVNIVFITHSHIDHYRNAGMFPKAKILEYFGLWDGASVQAWKENFSRNIRVIKTPGHDYTSLTMLVETGKGTVAICGDVFWKENFPEKDPYAQDNVLLDKSRKKVLMSVDYIIPGHAGMFKIKKQV